MGSWIKGLRLQRLFRTPVLNHPEFLQSEESIRKNRELFRAYANDILDRRDLPLSKIAMDIYFGLLNDFSEQKKLRKDKVTPREQHEQSHIVTMDAVLTCFGSRWIDPQKWGSEDAVFATEILHDVIEDFDVSKEWIQDELQGRVYQAFIQGNIPASRRWQIDNDIPHVANMVQFLSRKDRDGEYHAGDRVTQAKQWLETPYTFVIKMIDWNNKLQTMAGVDHFEEDGQARLDNTLRETNLIFGETRQNFVKKAKDRYPEIPEIKEICTALRGIMGIAYNALDAYKDVRSGSFHFDPSDAHALDFQQYYTPPTLRLLRALPPGCNVISPMMERLERVGRDDDKRVAAYVNTMLHPALDPLTKRPQTALLQSAFSTATGLLRRAAEYLNVPASKF